MQREIGSNFWVNPIQDLSSGGVFDPVCVGIHGSDAAGTSSGRGALSLILKTVAQRFPSREKKVLLPPFTCHTVIEPFLRDGYEVEYYAIDACLRTSPECLEEAIHRVKPSVILLHRYFGFETLPEANYIVQNAERMGITVIEDRTQCLYSDISPLSSSFCMGSLRKWAGLPDGGFSVCRDGRFPEHPDEYDKELEQAKLLASYTKYRYLFENIGEKETFLAMYRTAESILDQESRIYAISPASVSIQRSLDLLHLKRRRRENYQVLLDGLGNCKNLHPCFPELSENVVPLYFPAFVAAERRELQQYLASVAIYAPIVWPRPDMLPPVCKAAEDLYAHILCFPVDQRYDVDDMERIVKTVYSFNREYDHGA